MINYADGREYDLVFDEEKHSYTVDGEKVHSVTRVIDACFPKHLVDWAVDEGVKAYQNEMDKVPSKDGLYELEQTHAELIEERIKTAYKEKGDHAANIGNIVHEWIRNRINGDDADPWRDTHVNAESGRHVCPETIECRMAERDLPGVAHQQGNPDGGKRMKHDHDEQIGKVAALQKRQNQQACESDQDFHFSCFVSLLSNSQKRPSGRKMRNPRRKTNAIAFL